MSKTGAWILELQEEFEYKVADIIKESENVAEAYATAVKLNDDNHYVNWDNSEIECLVDDMWGDYWSNYQ
jgi:hypothetical protein